MFTLTLLHVVYSGCERTKVLVLSCLAVVFHLRWKKYLEASQQQLEFTFSSRIATSGTLMLNVNFVFQQGLNPLSLTGFVAGFGSPLKSSLWPLKITWAITILDYSKMLWWFSIKDKTKVVSKRPRRRGRQHHCQHQTQCRHFLEGAVQRSPDKGLRITNNKPSSCV